MSTNRIQGRKGQEIRKRHFRANPLCVMCEAEGRVRMWEELDHIIAIANGGSDTDDNRQGLCKEHHRIKTAKDLGIRYRPKIGADGWPIRDTKVERGLSTEAQERRFPSDLLPSCIPLTMLCGPPGSGKSTYLRAHVQPNDLVIDLDAISQGLSGLPEHHAGKEWVSSALDERNRLLRSLATDTKHERAWFVIAAADPVERARWASTLGAAITLLDTPLDECIRRINADPARVGHTERMIANAISWWTDQTRTP